MGLSILFRIIIFYLFILIAYKIINKQELKGLTIADSIIIILTIQLLIEVLFNNNQNIFIVIFPILTLVFLRPMIKKYSLKKDKNNKVLIDNGKINFKYLASTKYTISTLLNELASRDVSKLEDIKTAYLSDKELVIDSRGGPLLIIFDGCIDYQILSSISKTPEWLFKVLESKNLNLDNIYYSFYIDERLFIIQKDL